MTSDEPTYPQEDGEDTPTPETLLTPDGVEAGVAARLTAYTRGQRRGPLTGDVYLWAYSAALAGWRTSELRLAEAEKGKALADDALGLVAYACGRAFAEGTQYWVRRASEWLESHAALAHDKEKP